MSYIYRFTLKLISLTLVLGGLSLSSSALAAPSSASRFLKTKQTEVAGYVRKSQDDKLKSAMKGMLDYEELSKRALASEWDKHSKKEREAFVALLKKLVERNYEDNIRSTLDYKVNYVREKKKSDEVIVFTVAKSKKQRRSPSISIDYRLKQEDGNWLIFDIITDGVSLVNNYRQQFRRILRKDGWDGLMDRMRSKAEKA